MLKIVLIYFRNAFSRRSLTLTDTDPELDQESLVLLRKRAEVARNNPGESIADYRVRFNERKQAILENLGYTYENEVRPK